MRSDTVLTINWKVVSNVNQLDSHSNPCCFFSTAYISITISLAFASHDTCGSTFFFRPLLRTKDETVWKVHQLRLNSIRRTEKFATISTTVYREDVTKITPREKKKLERKSGSAVNTLPLFNKKGPPEFACLFSSAFQNRCRCWRQKRGVA